MEKREAMEQKEETDTRVAKENKQPMLLGRLIVDDDHYFAIRGSFTDLLSRELRKTTILLWIIWTGCSFIYYGVVLMTTELFETPGDQGIQTKRIFFTLI